MRKYKLVFVVAVLIFSTNFVVKKAFAGSIDTTIKTVAILPFYVSLDSNNLPNGISGDNTIRIADINSFRFQRALHTWFLKKSRNHKVTFQQITQTNDLLKQHGYVDSLSVLSKQNLCNLLGVDAVIYGKANITNRRESVGHEVMSQVVGIDFSSAQKIKMELNLYNSAGLELWEQNYQGSGVGSPDNLIDACMRARKKFPF